MHAIVTVPVKEEDVDEEDEQLHDEERGLPHPQQSSAVRSEGEQSGRGRNGKRKAAVEGEISRRRLKRYSEVREDNADSQDEGSNSERGRDDSGDEDNDASYEPNLRRDEDEDELMIGVEVMALLCHANE